MVDQEPEPGYEGGFTYLFTEILTRISSITLILAHIF